MGLPKRKKDTPMSAPPTKKTKTEENGGSESWSTLIMGGKGRKGEDRKRGGREMG